MTRHELRDGSIYLIKDIFFVLGTWSEKHNKFFRFKVDEAIKIDDKNEWVEIDPGLAFTIFKNHSSECIKDSMNTKKKLEDFTDINTLYQKRCNEK